jgi:hypothetical protein
MSNHIRRPLLYIFPSELEETTSNWVESDLNIPRLFVDVYILRNLLPQLLQPFRLQH